MKYILGGLFHQKNYIRIKIKKNMGSRDFP